MIRQSERHIKAGSRRAGLFRAILKELRHPIVKWAYIFMLPGVIWLILLHFYPIFRAFYLSFHRWSGNITQSASWMGLNNYVRIFGDSTFWRSVINTFYYVLLTVPINTFVSLVIAVLLWNIRNLRSFYRALYFLPSVAGLVIASTIWRWCYDPMFGVFNFLLSHIGFPRLNWLSDRTLAMPSIAIMTIWQNMGYYVVIFIAGLTSIPSELYEVSRIDGASKLRQFFAITFPLVGPVTLFVLIISTIRNLKIFGQIFVMTSGGPGGATETIGFKIYEEAFTYRNYGVGTAMAIIMFLIILFVTLIQYGTLERRTRVEY